MQIDVNNFFISGSGYIRKKHKFQNQLDVYFCYPLYLRRSDIFLRFPAKNTSIRNTCIYHTPTWLIGKQKAAAHMYAPSDIFISLTSFFISKIYCFLYVAVISWCIKKLRIKRPEKAYVRGLGNRVLYIRIHITSKHSRFCTRENVIRKCISACSLKASLSRKPFGSYFTFS